MKRTILSTTLALCLTMASELPSFAQSVLNNADREFSKGNYTKAIKLYNKFLEKGKANLLTAQRLAEAYRVMGNNVEAENWYGVAANFDAAPANIHWHYAQLLRSGGKCEEAKVQYLKFGKKTPKRAEEAQKLAASCTDSQKWAAKPRMVKIEADSALNTAYADLSPIPFRDGILFASNRKQVRVKKTKDNPSPAVAWEANPYLMLYFAKGNSTNGWESFKALPKSINDKYHTGPAAFSSLYTMMIYTSQMVERKEKANPPKSFTAAFNTNAELLVAFLQGEKWIPAGPLPFTDIDEYTTVHPAFSPNGRVLYFASDMPGGFGGLDLYVTEYNGARWSKPANLGPTINTPGNEMFPYIASDGTLYFSSNGHPGMGGLDIYSATGALKAWQNVTNLRFPYNTVNDDFGVMMNPDNKSGYLTSNRDGNDNLYKFEVTGADAIQLVASAKFNEGGAPSEVVFDITKDGDSLAAPMKAYANADGRRNFEIERYATYTIKAYLKGYDTAVYHLNTDSLMKVDNYEVALTLNKPVEKSPVKKIKKIFDLKDVYFAFNKAVITPVAIKDLNYLVGLLDANQIWTIELVGHADSRGSKKYNLWLSKRRAQSAAFYLYSQGVDRSRVTIKGMGEMQLVNKCADGVICPEKLHAENRRTEFKPLTYPKPAAPRLSKGLLSHHSAIMKHRK